MSTTAIIGQSPLPIDYSAEVFGDEPLINIDESTWGAIRMKRCLDSLKGVQGAVLEVGCGAGRCVRTVGHYRPDLCVYGCDLGLKALQTAQKQGGGVIYAQSDAARLPYADGTFAAVIVLDLIEHVPDVAGVLEEIARVLQSEGVLHLHVPCEGNRLSLYRPLLRRGIDLTREAVGHLHHFSTRQVIEHLKQAGFHVGRKRYSMYPVGQIHDMIGWKSRIQSRDATRNDADADAGDNRKHRLLTELNAVPKRKRIRLGPAGWRIAQAMMTRAQFLEVRLAGWQPIGSIGLCVTARKVS